MTNRALPAVPGFTPPVKEKTQPPITKSGLLRSLKTDAGWTLIESIAEQMITDAKDEFFATEEGSKEEREQKFRARFYQEFWTTLNHRINTTVAQSGQVNEG